MTDARAKDIRLVPVCVAQRKIMHSRYTAKGTPTYLKRLCCLYTILERFANCSFRRVKASFLLSADTIIVLKVSIYGMQTPLALMARHST